MIDWKLINWCSVAVHQIRYGPDREAVFLELKQHLDERSDSFLAKGMAEKEATEKTLEVMGNPYALAVTLGKIHRPYWGYAYSIFRVLAMILVVSALVFTAANMIFSLTGKTYTQPKYNDYSPSYTDTETEHMTRIGFWEQSDSDSFGGYTYQLEKAALWDRKVNGYSQYERVPAMIPFAPRSASPIICHGQQIRKSQTAWKLWITWETTMSTHCSTTANSSTLFLAVMNVTQNPLSGCWTLMLTLRILAV